MNRTYCPTILTPEERARVARWIKRLRRTATYLRSDFRLPTSDLERGQA